MFLASKTVYCKGSLPKEGIPLPEEGVSPIAKKFVPSLRRCP
jgi:hypothetical protein